MYATINEGGRVESRIYGQGRKERVTECQNIEMEEGKTRGDESANVEGFGVEGEESWIHVQERVGAVSSGSDGRGFLS